MEVYFFLGNEAHYAKKLSIGSRKTFFLKFLALLHYKVFNNVIGSGTNYIVEHFVVQKCEEFQKKSFSRANTQLFRVVRFVPKEKVNFHEKTQSLFSFLEDCNLTP